MKQQKRLRGADLESFIIDVKKGLKQHQLIKKYDVSKSTISRIKKINGLANAKISARMTEIQTNKYKISFIQKVINKISGKKKVTHQISTQLKVDNIDLSKNFGRGPAISTSKIKQIISLKNAGISNQEVSNKLKVHKSSVSYHYKKYLQGK